MKKRLPQTFETRITKKLDRLEKVVERLAESTVRGFADIEQRMATKADLANLRDDMEVMMGKYIGTFRRDYDELAHRVKKLEVTVFRK